MSPGSMGAAAQPSRWAARFQWIAGMLPRRLARATHARFVRRAGLAAADAIPTHVSPVKKRWLYAAARDSGGVILEIGSYVGASACFLAAGAVRGGRPFRLHCVDTWRNDAMTEGNRDTWREFQSNTAAFSASIVPHRGESAAVAAGFGEPIDLLFIDGDHSYEGCRCDVEAWMDKVRPGGLVFMHDAGWADGVKRVIREQVASRVADCGMAGDNLWWGRMKGAGGMA